MVAAARKYGRMVQVGSQSRSIAHKIKAVRMLQDGVIGKVYMALGDSALSGANPSATHLNAPVPPGVDWNKFRRPGPNGCRLARTVFFTTGTGSGTQATAISEIKVFTRWISRDGV